jgi:ABC-type dipeptide/oligopeptide/nickel transport system ATPase component
VLGESGSGKSTLAASVLRLLPANGKIHQGCILFEGRDILQARRQVLENIRGKRIALINQEPSAALHPTMRVRDQVSEVLGAHEHLCEKERKERLRQVFTMLFDSEAERISSSYPHQLSGGQRQRVLIAQAIICGPSLLIADEPTASLDPTTQGEILSIFENLRRSFGVAIILITHNPSLLAGLADRVLVLYRGRIVEFGPAETVLFHSPQPYTRALLGCLPPPLCGINPARRKTKLGVDGGTNFDAPSAAPRCERARENGLECCQTREPLPRSKTLGSRVGCSG